MAGCKLKLALTTRKVLIDLKAKHDMTYRAVAREGSVKGEGEVLT